MIWLVASTLRSKILGMDYLYHLKWPIEVLNILLRNTEIVTFASLRPYIWSFWVSFVALRTQNYRKAYLEHLNWPIEVRWQLFTGIYGFIELPNEYFTHIDWKYDFNSLKPYIWPWFIHFLAIKIQNLRNG